jgi:hypothetical protein
MSRLAVPVGDESVTIDAVLGAPYLHKEVSWSLPCRS